MHGSVPEDGELAQAALTYAERGWPVFPCDPATKRPVLDRGLLDASTDASTVRHWWTRWPGAMIGLRTGAESGVWVVDLDNDEGQNGIEAFYDLAQGRLIPETTKTATPRNGVHLFFRWVEGIRNSASKLAAGVDTRGENGCVILPPSRRSDGKRYQCLADVWPDPPPAPQWLLDLVLAPAAKPDKLAAQDSQPPKPRTNGSADAYGRAALDAECANVAGAAPGTRNHVLNRAAFALGQLVGSGDLSEGEVRRRLSDAAAGLAQDDGAASVAKTIDSGLVAGTQEPRQRQERRQEAPRASASEPPAATPWSFHSELGPEPTAWLIKGLLPETGAGLVSGQWGSYKTTVALDVAVSVMAGIPFAGRFAVKRQGGVAYLALEGAGGLASRLTAIARTRGIAGILPFAYRPDCPPLTAPDALDQLAAMIEDAARNLRDKFGVPLVLIFVDTIVTAAGYAKSGDDNDAASAQRVMSALAGLSLRSGALVLGVDHFGKVAETGTRGSSAKEGAADVVVALLCDRELSGAVTNTRLAIRKLRDGVSGLELPFTARKEQFGTDPDNEPITRVVIDWEQAQAQPEANVWSRSLQLLRRILMACLVESGADIQPFPDGPVVRACDLELVRREFYKQHAADGTEEKKAATRRKAFRRAVDDAQARGLIATREVSTVQLVWLAKPESQP